MKNSIIIIIIIAAVVILGVLFFTGQGIEHGLQMNEESQSDLERLSSLTFSDYQGNPVSLADFEGKPLVVNSWAVWCPFCVKELDDFATLQEEFSGQVTVIAIDRAEPLEKAKSFTDNLGITDKMHFWLDPQDKFYKAIGGFGMPETLFINSAGEIVIHKRGPMDLEEIRQKTAEII